MRQVAMFVLFLSLFALSVPSRAAVALLDKDNWKFLFGGFVQADYLNDSTRSLTEVAGNNPIAPAGTVAGDNGRTSFSGRNSRIAFTLLPPNVEAWKIKGYFEADFLGYDPQPPGPKGGGNSESGFLTNATLRIRHYYMQTDNGDWILTAGQTWTLFGWQPYFILSTLSVPPVSGVLYQRTPQATVIRNIRFDADNMVQVGVSVIRPSYRDSQIPGVDAGVRAVFGSRKGVYTAYNSDRQADPMGIGISGTARTYETDSPTTRYTGTGVAVDAMIPIIGSSGSKDIYNKLSLQGEFTAGSGYGDEFPGYSGNITPGNPAIDSGLTGTVGGAFTIVALQTFNVSLQYQLPEGWDSFATVGYGQLRATNVAGMSASSGVIYDRAETGFVNFFHDFTKNLRTGAEVDYFQTRYINGTYGRNWRFQVTGLFRI